jgi:hypothetical protein
LSAEVFYLSALREAPGLKYLFLPEMPDAAIAAATASITTQTPPLDQVFFKTRASHPGIVDIVKASRRTLISHQNQPTFSEPMLQALLLMEDTNLCI